MNERYDTYMNDEVEINLADMVCSMLKNWRSLVIVSVIGALLGAGLYILQYSVFRSEVPVEEPAGPVADYVVGDELRAVMDLTAGYRALYTREVEYISNSFIMKMDPNSVVRGELSYDITTEEHMSRIVGKFQDVINNGDLIAEMKTAAQVDCDDKYIKELLEVSGQVPVNGIGTRITYTLSFIDADACQKMFQVLEKYADDVDEECRRSYDTYTAEKTDTLPQMTVDSYYLEVQNQYIINASEHREKFTALESGFSAADRRYYQVMYLGYADYDLPVNTTDSRQSGMILWAVLGVFIFVMCWGISGVVSYLVNGCIKTADEIPKIYGMPLMGKIIVSENGLKGPDRWIFGLRRQCNQPFEDKEYVESMIRGRKEAHIMLCGNLADDITASYMSDFGTDCQNMKKSMMVHRDPDALAEAKEADGVILFVCVGKTKRTELYRELEICRIEEIHVMGAVVAV